MSTIYSIQDFISKNLSSNCSDYIVLECRIMNSFLDKLRLLGFKLLSANDGEEEYLLDNEKFKALDVIFSVDSSSLTIESNESEKFTLYLTLGNGEATTISNHSTMPQKLEKRVLYQFGQSVKEHSKSLYEESWA